MPSFFAACSATTETVPSAYWSECTVGRKTYWKCLSFSTAVAMALVIHIIFFCASNRPDRGTAWAEE